jgi:transposase
MTHKLSGIEKGRLTEKIDNGLSFRKAAAEFGITHQTVSRIYKAIKKNGTIQRKKGSGAPKKWSKREARIAKRLILNREASNAVEVQRILERDHKITLAVRTVREILRSTGLNGRAKIKKPLLTHRQKKLRLKYAKKYRLWTKEQWRKVMFSDESKISRFGSDGREYCWRKKNEQLSERTTMPTVKCGGGSIMVWGCFGYNGVGWATRITGTMNSELYKEVLTDEMKNSIEYCLPPEHQGDFIFQQDNAPCHKSKIITGWFEKEEITVIDHPPQSPDLNPIENLWQQIKAKLHKDASIKGVDDLWEKFENCWEQVDVEMCHKLIESMPDRLEAVIKAKGGHTKW